MNKRETENVKKAVKLLTEMQEDQKDVKEVKMIRVGDQKAFTDYMTENHKMKKTNEKAGVAKLYGIPVTTSSVVPADEVWMMDSKSRVVKKFKLPTS